VKIAQTFISVDFSESVINEALELLGTVSSAGRAYLFLFNFDGETMDNTHEWCNQGVAQQIENLKQLPLNMFPWWIEKLSNENVIFFENVEMMSDEAKAEQAILHAHQIKSIIVLPVKIDGELCGFIGLDNFSAELELYSDTTGYLRVAGEMIGLSIKRSRVENQTIFQKEQIEKAHRQLKLTQAHLLSTEKLAGIGQLAAGVAHEINNPVGYVMSNSESIVKYFERICEYISLIDSEAGLENIALKRKQLKIDLILEDLPSLLRENLEGLRRIAEIVKNLKTFSRIDDSGKMSETNINECVRSTLHIAHNEIKYHSDVETELNEIPFVYCNGGEINQVLLNIIMNASQAIKSQASSKRGIIRVRTSSEGPYVTCEIEDNGPGIPEKIIGRIFDPFFTTKDVGKGTGLGLSIAFDIITNKHRGILEVFSREGQGARFKIHLPVRRSEEPSE
jgi:signal transduction histidine kinase